MVWRTSAAVLIGNQRSTVAYEGHAKGGSAPGFPTADLLRGCWCAAEQALVLGRSSADNYDTDEGSTDDDESEEDE